MIPPELWSDEYFIDQIERQIKHQISMLYFVRHERKPTKLEYEELFAKFIYETKCEVTDYDLGIFND